MNNLLVGTNIIVLLLCAFLAYKQFKPKAKVEKLTKEQQDEIKKREEGFKNIMDYDYAKALERKKT